MISKQILFFAALTFVAPGAADSAVINYHFTSNASTPAPTGAEAAGVIGSDDDSWTTISSTLGSNSSEIGGGDGLDIALGSGLNVTLDNYYNHTGGNSNNNASPFGPFINGWFSREANQGPPSLTFSGFASTDVVSLVIFSASHTNENRGILTVSADGASSSSIDITAGPTQPSAYVAAPGASSNFALFSNLQPDGAGEIVVTLDSNGNFSDFNGFQLQVIPEPGTLSTLGLGALSLLLLRRRK